VFDIPSSCQVPRWLIVGSWYIMYWTVIYGTYACNNGIGWEGLSPESKARHGRILQAPFMWYLLLLYSCNLCVLPFTVVYYSFIENEYFLAFNYAFKKRLHFLSLSCFVVVNQYSFFSFLHIRKV